jgi:hypothetical protein
MEVWVEALDETVQVPEDVWVQICINAASLASLYEFDTRHNFWRNRDLVETKLSSCDGLYQILMASVSVSMHQNNCQTCNTASLFDLIQGVSEICLVKIFFDNIVDTVLPINNVCIFFKILQWTNPLFDFKDLFINWHGCSDLQVKYLGSWLIANLKCISKAFSYQ